MPFKDKEKRKKYIREYNKKYRKEHPEKAKEVDKKYYEKNKDKKKKYREEHMDEYKEYQKRYKEENPDKVKESNKNWAEKNKDKITAQQKKYTEEHRAERNEYNKRYRKENPDKIRKYKEDNPDKIHNESVRRRAAIGSQEITKHDWIEIMKLTDWKCAYCSTNLTLANRTLDHIIPLSKGGFHIKTNLVPCCGVCNSSKNAKLLCEWYYPNKIFLMFAVLNWINKTTMAG